MYLSIIYIPKYVMLSFLQIAAKLMVLYYALQRNVVLWVEKVIIVMTIKIAGCYYIISFQFLSNFKPSFSFSSLGEMDIVTKRKKSAERKKILESVAY